MIKRSAVFKYLLPLAIFSSLTPAFGQTGEVLKNLVVNHGSLAAGDVVFTNFRLPLLQFGTILPVGDTFPVLYDGADVSVQASLAADGKIALVLTPIDTATGLPKPYAVNAKPGAALPTDKFRYIEYDVVVTNPLRRLHGVDRAFGPGTTAVMASTAQNSVQFFDATQPFQFQYQPVGADILFNGTLIGNTGTSLLPGGDRAGARFSGVWGLISGDWGGIRVGNATLDSVSIRFSLADVVAPGARPAARGELLRRCGLPERTGASRRRDDRVEQRHALGVHGARIGHRAAGPVLCGLPLAEAAGAELDVGHGQRHLQQQRQPGG